jgi:cellulose synthase/poly-beta-1,6-N-acetylglucosamine synthase-like glycosyltransferase
MTILHIFFWLCIATVLYTYAFYPLLIAVIAKLRGHPVRPKGQFTGSVSIVLPFYNEEPFIARRLDELTHMLASTGLDTEIIAVSDGSTDRSSIFAQGYTERRVRAQHLPNGYSERRMRILDLPTGYSRRRVRILELPKNTGKAEALTRACDVAVGDVIVFADSRQHWAPDALEKLLKNFFDPAVGGVSGDLIIESGPGLLSGVGRYWQYEKWIRRNESLIHSSAGVTGAISAVRRELFCPIPKRTVLDDVYWPMQVVLQGYRVIHDESALAYDRLPENAGDEFRRKVRTLTGNFQLLTLLPALLLPWRNPIWFQFVSHKVMRLIVPWALLVLFIVSALLPELFYRLALVSQLAFYVLGLMGIRQGGSSNIRMASAAGSFIILNTAAWLAFWFWLAGKTADTWHQVSYHPDHTAAKHTSCNEPSQVEAHAKVAQCEEKLSDG